MSKQSMGSCLADATVAFVSLSVSAKVWKSRKANGLFFTLRQHKETHSALPVFNADLT